MEIEYDPDKDAINLRKHGYPLRAFQLLDLDNAVIMLDDRVSYGEDRFVAFAWMRTTMMVAVYTMRDEVYRVISLRKAKPREVRRYG